MIYSLQGFRVLLCLLVFLFHINSQVATNIELFSGFGTLAVSYFFILSGFVHYISYKPGATFTENKQKTIKRIINNYPLHWICLILMIPLKHSDLALNFKTVERILINASLLQSWIPIQKVCLDFNGASWFLSDMIFMLVMTVPLCKLSNKIKSAKSLLLAILGIQFIELIFSVLLFGEDSQRILYFNPLIRLLDYFAGIVVAKIFKRYGKEFALNNIYELFTIILIIVLSFIYKYIPKSFTNAGTLYLIPACFSIFILSTQNGFISRFFSQKFLVGISKGTMYFYMVHQVVNINFKGVLLHLNKSINTLSYYTLVGGGQLQWLLHSMNFSSSLRIETRK